MVSTQKFSTYLRKPYDLDAEAEQDLREVVKKYPYFNNAWLLLARALQNQNSPLFDDSLKQAGMYAGDRALLYKLVNIDVPETEEPVNEVQAKEVAAITTVTTPKEIEPAPESEIIAETAPTAEIAAIETTPEKPNIVALPSNASEEDKVVSAYNEIFGGDANTESNVSNEFEQFDINEPFYPNQKAEETEEEEEEFLLAVDEPQLLETPEIAVPKVENAHQIETETPATTSEEEFELQLGEHLDTDHDGIIAPKPSPETSEEALELAIADKVAETKANTSEDEKETPVAENLDTVQDEITAQKLATETAEEDLKLALAAIEATPTQEVEEEKIIDTAQAEEPRHEIETPIAFKLDRKPAAPVVQPVEENKAEEIKVEETRVEENTIPENTVEETKEIETTTQENILVPAGDFYEWLAHLENPTPTTEKKNEVNEVMVAAPTAEIIETPPAPKKTSVDEIIERFITIQPRISRPKVEFFNPTQKAKESDTEADDLATETLARIYRTQKLYDKATEVYQKLLRIHPEKAAEYETKIAEIELEKGK